MRLHEFTIPIGKALSLSLVGLDYKSHEFKGQLLGFQEGQNVLISLDTKPGQVLLHSGLKAKVNIRLADGLLSFDSEIELVCESPFLYLHLEYPYGVEFQHLRHAIRVPVETPIDVKAFTGLGMTSASIHGHMLDVSTGGARLVVEKELTQMVTKISLGVQLTKDDLERDMTLMAKISRSGDLSPDHPECGFSYGVKFIELDPVDSLFLRSFCQHHTLLNEFLLC
ncbi:MAG: PilZ domain-containing protein [Spongiibacteraceae bacterium]|nr:PilZ domain-containing protein [Spongiibacteraceae bacterium]